MIKYHKQWLRKLTIVISVFNFVLTVAAAVTPGVVLPAWATSSVTGRNIGGSYSVFQYCSSQGDCQYTTLENIGCTETVSRLRSQGAFLVFHAVALIGLIPTMVGEIRYITMPMAHLSQIWFGISLSSIFIVWVLMLTTLISQLCGEVSWSDKGGWLGSAFPILMVDFCLSILNVVLYVIGMRIEEEEDSVPWGTVSFLPKAGEGIVTHNDNTVTTTSASSFITPLLGGGQDGCVTVQQGLGSYYCTEEGEGMPLVMMGPPPPAVDAAAHLYAAGEQEDCVPSPPAAPLTPAPRSTIATQDPRASFLESAENDSEPSSSSGGVDRPGLQVDPLKVANSRSAGVDL